jgi:hypothetical protein
MRLKIEGRAYIDCASYWELQGRLDEEVELATPRSLSTADFRKILASGKADQQEERKKLKKDREFHNRYFMSEKEERKMKSVRFSTYWAKYDKIEVLVDPKRGLGAVSLPSSPSDSYLLCPSHLRGFSFSTRSWGKYSSLQSSWPLKSAYTDFAKPDIETFQRDPEDDDQESRLQVYRPRFCVCRSRAGLGSRLYQRKGGWPSVSAAWGTRSGEVICECVR